MKRTKPAQATAAAAVGCSTKSIQRFLTLTGGLKRRVTLEGDGLAMVREDTCDRRSRLGSFTPPA
jgi:hypothetical protein